MLVGDARPAAGMQSVGFDINLMQISGTVGVIPGLLWFETRPQRPDSAPVAFTGSYVNTTGHHAFQQSVTSTTDKFFVAPVLFYKLSSAGVGTAMVQVKPTYQTAGRALGTRDVVVNPLNGTDASSYFPLTGWQPALGASKVMASVVAMGVNNGNVQTALGIRTAVDASEPADVELCESWDTPGTGNSARNTGQLSIPGAANITTSNLFQLVLAVRKSSSGSANSLATFRASTALITA